MNLGNVNGYLERMNKQQTEQNILDRVLFQVVGRVAVISLNRPERLNAFDATMYKAINQALEAFCDNDELWVAVIQSSCERAFSAGADVRALNDNANKGIMQSLGGIILDDEMVTSKPILAAVHGHCVGEGVNLILSCDMVFADKSANFVISEAKVGTNAIDIPIKLAKKIGYAKAFAFLTPGDGKDAHWCERAGLVEVISENVKAEALAFAQRICDEAGPLAIRAQKEVLWSSVFAHSPDQSIDRDAQAKSKGQALRNKIRLSNDYKEGRTAFLEKRKPNFKGR